MSFNIKDKVKKEECRLLGFKTQLVPHRKRITSPLQSPAC
jgi:hypothetical protein